jgi:hypothetical protein
VITAAIEALKIKVLTATKSSVPAIYVPPRAPPDHAAITAPRQRAAAASAITTL